MSFPTHGTTYVRQSSSAPFTTSVRSGARIGGDRTARPIRIAGPFPGRLRTTSPPASTSAQSLKRSFLDVDHGAGPVDEPSPGTLVATVVVVSVAGGTGGAAAHCERVDLDDVVRAAGD